MVVKELSIPQVDKVLTEGRITRGNWIVEDLDYENGEVNISPEIVLGRKKNREGKVVEEKKWIETHTALLKDVRAVRGECLDGYSYMRDEKMCMMGLAVPEGDEELNSILKDVPFTTIIDPGGQELPRTQKERANFFAERMKKVKYVVVVIGGLLENRLVMEGAGIEMHKAVTEQFLAGDATINPEEVAVVVMDHSGAEYSYKNGADLRKVTPKFEQRVLHVGIERILKMMGKSKEDIFGMMGHSKGGFLVEQEINTGEYPNAVVVEWAMVVMGKQFAKRKNRKKWPKYIMGYPNIERPAIKVQNGILARIVDIALLAPEMKVRDMLIDAVGPWIAKKFTGRDAAYGAEAIMGIVHELKKNKQAVWAQQGSLNMMEAIVRKFEETADNLRLIFSFREDSTLEHAHQFAYKDARYTYDYNRGVDVSDMREASAKAMDAQHNPNMTAIVEAGKWVAKNMARKVRQLTGQKTEPRDPNSYVDAVANEYGISLHNS